MEQLTPDHMRQLEASKIDVELALRLGLSSEDLAPRTHRCSSPELFNGDVLGDTTLEGEPVVITGHALTCVAAVQAGFVRSVAVAGRGGECVIDLIDALRDAREIILAGDEDLNAELARLLGPARCKFLRFPPGIAGLDSALQRYGDRGVAAIIRAAKPYPIAGVNKLSDYPPPTPRKTYKTEWSNLDYHLKMWPGEFMVIGGIPSSGKSLWSVHLMAGMARLHGHRIAMLCFEDDVVPDIVDALRDYYTKGYGKTVQEADTWIEEHFVFIDQSLDPDEDEDEITIGWIIDTAKQCVERYQIDWLLIDPWNEIEHKRLRTESGEEYQGRTIRELKRLAKSSRVGVVVVTHPTKDVRDRMSGEIRTPGLYDLSGSAHWINKPDHGVIVNRPDAAGNTVEIIIEKSRRQRYGGKPGSKWLLFDEECGGFRPCSAPPKKD